MLSTMQKLSKDLIIYSVLTADFERLDFKNDALAGVRANYFNSNGSAQIEKTDITLDERVYGLSYSLKKGETLSWKVTFNQRPFQTVKKTAGDVYCVLTYGDNGIINKRIYFDNAHNWIRTEYYDKNLENEILAVLTPKKINGILALRYEKFGADKNKTSVDLFPSDVYPKKKCAALVYSNSGMIWYDASFRLDASGNSEEAEQTVTGFNFSLADFTSPASNPLDLKRAEYLSCNDVAEFYSNSDELIPEVSDSKPYSAYDKIEQILFEAHKTNKNIFGEIVSQTANDSVEKAPEEINNEEAPEEIDTENSLKKSEEPTEAPEGAEGAGEAEEKPKEELKYQAVENESPNAEIPAKGGVYSYYGGLNDSNERAGRGRIVSPDGITVYDGEYKSDKRSGFGICYYKDGSPNYVGSWSMGSRSGSGVGYRHSDGTMHVGKWLDNSPDGIGARFDKDGGFIDVCSYISGVRNGKSVSFDNNGNTVIRIWKGGDVICEKIISDEDLL